jgi:hypothetical protein
MAFGDAAWSLLFGHRPLWLLDVDTAMYPFCCLSAPSLFAKVAATLEVFYLQSFFEFVVDHHRFGLHYRYPTRPLLEKVAAALDSTLALELMMYH